MKWPNRHIMGYGKWIGGVLGWVILGPIGGLIGYLAGRAFDNAADVMGQQAASSGTARRTYSAAEQRNSFMVSLLVLSAAVIKADGRTRQAEMDYVKDFIRKNFGEDSVQEAMRLLRQMLEKDVNIYEVGPQIATYMNYSQRLQLFHYLVQIALADGDFSKSEKSVLEISPSATDDEVRTAYRRMAMKNHPDKVATLGPDVQKAAAEKFRQIQEAYDAIKKERGMN